MNPHPLGTLPQRLLCSILLGQYATIHPFERTQETKKELHESLQVGPSQNPKASQNPKH